MKKSPIELRLLPSSFKKFAFGILALSILLAILTLGHLLAIPKDLLKTVCGTGLLIGLLLLALSKDEHEDEFSQRIRLTAFASAFIFGVAYAIIQPFVNYLLKGQYAFENTATSQLIIMLMLFFLTKSKLKRNRQTN